MLLVASIGAHCAEATVELFAPNASEDLKVWLGDYPFVRLNVEQAGDGGVGKYDVKPRALLKLLERGYSEVIWLDSDILVCREFLSLFSDMPPDILVVAEEALCPAHGDPNALRARLWGFAVGRELPFTANTAVIRATQRHSELLRRWESLLLEPAYRAAQACDWTDRPSHLMGDQEVLTALLSSSEYASVPLTFLLRGRHVIQYFGPFGYTMTERLRNLVGGMPMFVHSQGFRPWWSRAEPKASFRGAFKSLYDDLSPYTVLARRYRRVLPESRWLTPSTAVRGMTILGLGQAPLIGFPLSFAFDLVRLGRAIASWSGRRPSA